MKTALVVGSGAGGATMARELQGKYQVTVLEAGQEFQPFTLEMPAMERLRGAGLLFDPREIRLAVPAYRTRTTQEGMILVNGLGLGGTTTLCAGNALRMDGDLQALGIDLEAEFAEIEREIPITTAHQKKWHRPTRELFAIFAGLGLDPQPMPKMGAYERCLHCGRCVLGCAAGVKWDSRAYLREGQARGARVLTGVKVERVVVEGGKAAGVWARQGLSSRFYPADLVVLAAGGLATPSILEAAGIPTEPALFVDPVLCVAAPVTKVNHFKEVPMPFFAQREGYILSPYFDYLSFFFNRDWRRPAGDILSIMIKLADDNAGKVSNRRVEKTLTTGDRAILAGAEAISREILLRYGVDEGEIFLGSLNAGHPGGCLPLTGREARPLHPDRLPENLYVADASLLPHSTGGPPILTIIALAKKIAKTL